MGAVCIGCGGAVTAEEEGACAFCRRAARGDDRLVAHAASGWDGGAEDCGCGTCGLDASGLRRGRPLPWAA